MTSFFFLHIPDVPGDVMSDVDSDFSDEESAGNLNKLGRRLMQTQCEYILHAYTDASDDEDEDANTYVEAQPPSNKRNRDGKKNIAQKVRWQEAALKFDMNITFVKKSDILPDVLSANNELELFELFFDKNFIDNVVEQPNRYALQRGKD